MRYALLIIGVLLFGSPFLTAQAPPGGARGMAMGGTGVAGTGMETLWTNPAGLPGVERIGATAFVEQRFALSELRAIYAGAVLPGKIGTFGIRATTFGFDTYREQQFALSYGRLLAENFSIGGSLIAQTISIENYGSKVIATFDLGLQARLSKSLAVGFRAYSPFRPEVVPGEPLAGSLALGLAYTPNEKVLILTDVEKDLAYDARVRVGLEYRPVEPLYLRAGITSGPAEISFGVGYLPAETVRLDFSARYHETLGISPGAGVVWRFNE